MALRQTGSCEVTLPEALFDADYPGHYFRRIKSVSLTIPAVTGPYTSINCTLTLLSSVLRHNPTASSDYRDYPSSGLDDRRFTFDPVPLQSIATSHGQNDSGTFELNFQGERYLPFEGAGAVSRWRLELDRTTNAFDLNTLPDVVFHIRYTAREGGAALKKAASTALAAAIADQDRDPLQRMFSLKHEFSNDWYAFAGQVIGQPGLAGQPATLVVKLSHDRFPFLHRGRTVVITQLDAFLGETAPGGEVRFMPPADRLKLSDPDDAGSAAQLPGNIPYQQHSGLSLSISPGGEASLSLSALRADPLLEDIVLVCHYTVVP